MKTEEPTNPAERLAWLREQQVQDADTLNARRVQPEAQPLKAAEPGDYYRGQVTPEDMAAIRQRHFDTAPARHAAKLVDRIIEAEDRKANPHALPARRPFAGVAQTLQNRWPR